VHRARAGYPGLLPRLRLPIRLSAVAGLVAASVILAACGVSDEGPTVRPAPTDPPPTSSADAPPSGSPTGAPTDAPPSGASGEPSLTAGPSGTPSAQCSGNDGNRDFFAAVAEAVSWDVYCAALPDGWFVESGTYRLSAGGWMEVGYRGPGSARFVLREGAFCQEGGDCVPVGTEVGAASFGDREGTLVAADDGSWAVTVDRGASLAWLATGSGLDEATFRGYAEALVLVGP